MGTYTTNKELYIPTVGEQGWGTLVNGNFETIDNFLKPITVSGSTYTFTGNQTGGSVSATSITNSGTLTSTGKITANGGIGTTTLTASSTSTFTGKITANGGIGTKALTATSISNSGKLTQTGTSTFTGKITANGGVNDYEERIATCEEKLENVSTNTEGTVYTGVLAGKLYVSGVLNNSDGLEKYASVTSTTQTVSNISSGSSTSIVKSSAVTINGTLNKLSVSYPIKVIGGVYIADESYLVGNPNDVLKTVTRTATVKVRVGNITDKCKVHFYVNNVLNKTVTLNSAAQTLTFECPVGSSCSFGVQAQYTNNNMYTESISISNETKYIYIRPE